MHFFTQPQAIQISWSEKFCKPQVLKLLRRSLGKSGKSRDPNWLVRKRLTRFFHDNHKQSHSWLLELHRTRNSNQLRRSTARPPPNTEVPHESTTMTLNKEVVKQRGIPPRQSLSMRWRTEIKEKKLKNKNLRTQGDADKEGTWEQQRGMVIKKKGQGKHKTRNDMKTCIAETRRRQNDDEFTKKK